MPPKRKIKGNNRRRWDTALPVEILTIIGEYIQCRNTFQALVGTSRRFRDVFNPMLYEYRLVRLHKCRAAGLDQKPLPPGLQYTKDIEICVFEFVRNPYNVKMNKEFVAYVVRLLKKVPRLRSFKWRDRSGDFSYSTSRMLQDSMLLRTLKNAELLENLSISFSGHWLDDPASAARCCFIPLKGFQNLKSLELYDCYGNLSQMAVKIAILLADCPSLKTLGLGISTECDLEEEDLRETLIVREQGTFLEKICSYFNRVCKATPLALQTLRLGTGLCVLKAKKADGQNYLSKLVKLSELERLHIFNGIVKYDWHAYGETAEVYWPYLTGCSSVYQLSVTRLTKNVRYWLKAHGQSISELVVTNHYGMYDEALCNFDALDLPNLSMLFVRECNVETRDHWDYDQDDEDEHDDWSDESSQLSLIAANTDVRDDDALEFEIPYKFDDEEKSVITVLDRLKDGGEQLTRLALCITLETQWKTFLKHLKCMPRLTHLRLSKKSHQHGRYPPKKASLRLGINRSFSIAQGYARLIKSLCPTLQFIKIGDWAWQIEVGKNSAKGKRGNSVVLRELSRDEVRNIEIFGITTFAEECGLSGIDVHKPTTDEEWDVLEQLVAEFEERRRQESLSTGPQERILMLAGRM
ncbi:hypothetical protein B0J14DRAFT_592862 [Halenospora varia]|nr:hypothetical protein B0J14DRAFT_592862 [Halenospora varia]